MKNSRAEIIIICGGYSKRWNNYLGVEKHFVKVNDTLLIDNTLHLLKKYSANVSLVVREDNIENFTKYNCKIATVNAEQASLEYYKIKSTYSLWNHVGRTIILMGDVWYTTKSIKKILTSRSLSISFWGRQKRNFHTKCPHGELFAISFYDNHFQRMRKACDKLEKYIEIDHIKIAGGWGVYNIISDLDFLMTSGEKVIRGKALFSNFNNITDVTDDIDNQADYDNLINALNRKKINGVTLSIVSNSYYRVLCLKNIIFELCLRFKKSFRT